MRWIILLATALLACACSKSGASKVERSSLDEAAVALAKKGLAPDKLDEVRLASVPARTCRAGAVHDLDLILCELDEGVEPKKAEEAGLKVVGETTGTALASGRVLLILADRRGADPSGKRMNEIARAFAGR